MIRPVKTSTWTVDSNCFALMVPKGSELHTEPREGRGRRVACITSLQSAFSDLTATALSSWRWDWLWEQGPEVSSAATQVLVIAAMWTAPMRLS